jgi:hydroxyethylthiazole kinase-like uncharacterized protein yjeF
MRGHALYSVEQIRAAEHAAQAALPPFSLMQRAGTAAADFARQTYGERLTAHGALVLAGPGNNGGDALVAAAHLAQAGVRTVVLHFADAARLSADARQALQLAQQGAVTFANAGGYAQVLQDHPDALIIDGLFGIGLARPLAAPFDELTAQINRRASPTLALDVPSGLDADTGNVIGGSVAIRAECTMTFIADKTGLHTGSGRDYAGRVQVTDLGIDARHFPAPHIWLTDPDLFSAQLRPRAQNSHKGSYGNAVIVGGADGMGGAAILAARAALHGGAGRVYALFAGAAPAFDPAQPELMCRSAHGGEPPEGVLVVGPGLGRSAFAHHLLTKAIAADAALVLDADALNMVAAEPALRAALLARRRPALITPHPLEAARLLNCSVADVQADRLASARSLARAFNAVAILKGSGSVIARPDGEIAINSSGNAALATAGTGDVLSGLCGALLAQDWPTWEAALAAAWLHGHAADLLVEQGTGPTGVAAGELIAPMRAALNRLIREYGGH